MRHPKALMPLVHAIESYEDTVRHLQRVMDGMMHEIENSETPTLTETDCQELKAAKNWEQTAAGYLKKFEGGFGNEK